MRSTLRAASTVALLLTGLLCGCDGDPADAKKPAILPVVPSNEPLRADAPVPEQPEERPAEPEEGFRTTDDGRSRDEKTRPDRLTGWRQTAAPIRYVRTVVRTKQGVKDRLNTITANRALTEFKLMNDNRMPKSLKELNDWYVKNTHPSGLPEPDNGGVYALDTQTQKLVIIDGN